MFVKDELQAIKVPSFCRKETAHMDNNFPPYLISKAHYGTAPVVTRGCIEDGYPYRALGSFYDSILEQAGAEIRFTLKFNMVY